MIKKLYTLLALLLILGQTVFAQALYPVSITEKLQYSTLVVEGKVIDKKSFWNPTHTMIYTANTVQVYKVFKGSIAPSTVEVLTVGGSVGLESIDASELLTLEKDETGVFFCYPNSIALKNPHTGTLLWDVYSSAQGFYRYDLQQLIADAPFVKYDNIVQDLYTELQNRIGHTYTTTDPAFVVPATVITPTSPLVVSITGFSPTTVNAGATLNPATNLLTITGSGFGTASGSAAILFDDANNGSGGTAFTVVFSDPLIVSWTDNQIQVRVPGRVGTGTFQVRDASGGTGTSPGTLTVGYGILTATFSSGGVTVTKESNLMSDNGLGGYNVVYSTSTAGGGVDLTTSPVKDAFQRALNTWKEGVGFNAVEAGTTTTQTVSPSDGLNTIMFDNTNTGVAVLASGVLAVCYSFNSMCLPLATNEVQKTEFDIVIRNAGVSAGTTTFTNGPCFPVTADIDMETVLLHELGHALNLAHINDNFQGSFLPNINPGKLMNFSVVNGVNRRSLDWSANIGATYVIQPQGNTYGTCTLSNIEMTPTTVTSESKDECPLTFPTASITPGTTVSFDLVHATSNKNNDPQYTAVNCAGTGTSVTNNAFYALRTNNTGGALDITVSGYTTVPAAQVSCSGAGVRLTLYQVSTCPTGQSFPAPTVCRTFNANGSLTSITGLAANTNYLIFADGLTGTKATFNLTFNGTAIPVKITDFSGVAGTNGNSLRWKLENAGTALSISLESSSNGTSFNSLYQQSGGGEVWTGNYTDVTAGPVAYYRLKITNRDGSVEYSNVLLLRQIGKTGSITITPNPVKQYLTVGLTKQFAGVLQFRLLDAQGRRVATYQNNYPAGTQSIQLAIAQGQPAGNYVLQIIEGTTTTAHKIVVQ